MERNSYNGDFERFLKENTEQYRMYPSEKVWQGVQKSINKRNRRYRITAFILLLSAISFVSIMLNSTKSSGSKEQAGNIPSSTIPPETNAGKTVTGLSSEKESNPTEININASASHRTLNRHTVNRQVNEPNDALTDIRNYNLLTARTEANPAELSATGNIDSYNQPSVFTDGPFSGAGFPLYHSDKADLLAISEFRSPLRNPENIENELAGIRAEAPVPQLNKRRTRASWQFHFTPTISYRRLSDNKQYPSPITTNNGYSYTSLLDVNDAVDHKPDIGFEIGFDGRYPISNRLKFRTGLQTNITRYGIRAYSYRSEVATIALNNGNGSPNSVNAISNYRNFSGTNSNWLENLYLQLSVPLGLDYTLAKTKDFQIGVSSSLQPTYLLGKKAYLISADYKNYVKVPGLIRTWNMNADIETFVTYGKGKIQWQVGPQVRYQLFSSFINKYPVRENLFDFGLKVGMSLNK